MTTGTPTPHERYVAAGYCPAVRWSGDWCNDDAGHSDPHWSLREWPGGIFVREDWPADTEMQY
jgi:hypothetical protein